MATPMRGIKRIQDLPPVKGFMPINYRRNIPNRGFGPFTLLGFSAFAFVYGFYKIGEGNTSRREIAEEKRQARINLVPVLQAEEDARWVKDTADKFVPQVYIGAWMPPAVNNPFMGVRPDNYK